MRHPLGHGGRRAQRQRECRGDEVVRVEAESGERGGEAGHDDPVHQAPAVRVHQWTRPDPGPPQRRGDEHPGDEVARGPLDRLARADRAGGVRGPAPEQPIEHVVGAARHGEGGPGEQERQAGAGAESEHPLRAPGAGTRAQRGPRHGREPEGRGGLHQGGDAEQQAGPEQRSRPRRAPLVGEHGDRPGRGREQDELGVDGQHVVGEERRPVDERERRGRQPAAVVAEDRRGGERAERDRDQRREEMDGEEPSAEHQLGRRVVRVEERRLVVDEVRVEAAAVHPHPRAHGMRGFVAVEHRDDQREPAREHGEGQEGPEGHEEAEMPWQRRNRRTSAPSGLAEVDSGGSGLPEDEEETCRSSVCP